MRHKRKKGTKRRRSRRVGAFSLGKKDTGLKLASVVGGFFLGDMINGQIDKLLTKVTPATTTTPTTTTGTPSTLAIVGEIGLGGLLLLRKGKPGGLGTAMKVGGGLLAGAGVRRALKSMGIITGYQSVPVIGRHRMAGYQSVPVIGKSTTPPQLSGRPAQLQGYRVNGYTPAGSGVNGYTPAGSGVLGAVGSAGSGITNSGSGYMG